MKQLSPVTLGILKGFPAAPNRAGKREVPSVKQPFEAFSGIEQRFPVRTMPPRRRTNASVSITSGSLVTNGRRHKPEFFSY